MNNDLEQFSEERLIQVIEHLTASLEFQIMNPIPSVSHKEYLAAFRIALAAKQAKSATFDRTNSFTESDLEGMSHGNNPVANAYRELLAFRIAAKQAKPAGYLENGKGFMYEPRHKDLIKNPTPVYTTPQPAHTEQDDWIKCSERMPPSSEPVWAYAQPGFEYAVEAYWDGNWYRTLTDEPEYSITHWMPLPAAPKPESE